MCLLTGGRLDLSRGAKHLPGRLIEHAHKKSQVWQTWSRLPSKVVSSFLIPHAIDSQTISLLFVITIKPDVGGLSPICNLKIF